MSEKNNVNVTQSGGIGFCGLLTIIFILLKLFGVTAVASWSWIWVLSPLLVPFVIVMGILVISLVVMLIGIFFVNK